MKVQLRYIALWFRTNIIRPTSFSPQRHSSKASLGPGFRSIGGRSRCLQTRITEDFPRTTLPLTVMKTISRRRPNELSETIHLSKRKTGLCARQAPRSELNRSCSESAKSNLSASDREDVCHFGGAWVDKRHTYTATSRQASFASLHWVKLVFETWKSKKTSP